MTPVPLADRGAGCGTVPRPRPVGVPPRPPPARRSNRREFPPTSGSTRRSATSDPKRPATRSLTVRVAGGRPRGSTRSRAARARPRGERIPLRAKEPSWRGTPRTRPSGRGRSRPCHHSKERPALGATSSCSRPSSRHSCTASGTRVRKASGPSSTRWPSKCDVRRHPPRWFGSSTVTSAVSRSSQAAARPAIPPPMTATLISRGPRCDRARPAGPGRRGRSQEGPHGPG